LKHTDPSKKKKKKKLSKSIPTHSANPDKNSLSLSHRPTSKRLTHTRERSKKQNCTAPPHSKPDESILFPSKPVACLPVNKEKQRLVQKGEKEEGLPKRRKKKKSGGRFPPVLLSLL
jgi:hypothetical protein